MSLTRKRGKAPGTEYWSRGGYPTVRMAVPGREAKTATHRLERRQTADEIRRVERTD